MPIISSISILSTRGYGQFWGKKGAPTPMPAGTVGVFYLASNTANTNKYAFAGRTMSASTALKAPMADQGAAAGNNTLMLGLGKLKATGEKYLWAGDVTQAGPNVSAYAIDGAGATSNGSQSMFQIGNQSAATLLYTYTTDALAVGASSLIIMRYINAAGNSSVGLFHNGRSAAVTTQRYTYATTAWVAGTNMTVGYQGGAAVGVAAYGIFTVGTNATTTVRYTYADDTVVAATAMPNGTGYGAAAGNDTSGLYVSGQTTPTGGAGGTTTSEYIWANNVTANGTALTAAAGYAQGSGNGTTGVNIA